MREQSTELLIEKLGQDLTPVRRLAPTPSRFFSLLLLAFGMSLLGALTWSYAKDGFWYWPQERSLASVFLLVLLVAWGSWKIAALSQPSSSSPQLDRRLLVMSLIWGGLPLILFSMFYLQNRDDLWIALDYPTWTCTAVIYSVAFPAGTLLYLWARKGAVLFGSSMGFALSATAAGTGALALGFICNWDDPLHVLIWHVLPCLLLCGLGYGLGRKLFQMK